MTNLNADPHIVVGNYFVSEQVSRVVEAIHDYEPLIEVQWLPPESRRVAPGEKLLPAFKLVYHDPNGPERGFTLFHVTDESEFDNRVLQRIIVNDHRNGKPTLSEYEAWVETNKRIERQKYLDKIEAAADVAAHVFKSHLNTYRVSKDLVIKDGVPFNAKRLKG